MTATRDAEILLLRHQITVLQRQLNGEKVQFTPADRALPRRAAAPTTPPLLYRLRLLVRPGTVLRWHRDLIRRRHAAISRPRPGGAAADRALHPNTDDGRCLQTVPGLAACVEKRATCNVTSPAGQRATTGVTMTSDRARAEAAGALGAQGPQQVVRTTAARFTGATKATLAGAASDDGILVVTGDGAVSRFNDRPLREHRGYRLVFHERQALCSTPASGPPAG